MTGELLTSAQMQAAERAAMADGVSGATLMRRAGEGAAAIIAERFPRASVLVLAGPGSNGGDGFVIARRLQALGRRVRVAATPTAPRAADALAAREAFEGPVIPLGAALPAEGEVVVDAVFGTGLARSLDGEILVALKRIGDGAGHKIVAVDLPSGVQADTGRVGAFALPADLTVTFHRKKLGHLLEPGRSLCGEVVVLDIGLKASEVLTFENTEALWADAYPRPQAFSHKTRRGRLMVLSGPPLATGAARLAARAGLCIGAGVVTVLTSPAAALVNAIALEAIMVARYRTTAELTALASAATAVVIGPAAGVGPALREQVLALKGAGVPLVVDADAITSFRETPETLFACLTPKDVLTPHVGEFDRLFPGLLEASPDRVSAAREAARRSGAVVLLKGADTVVAAPDGRASVNAHASPFLATAGSGDVLAGVIGGLLAQGLEAFLAASAGAFLHGDAGLRGGPGLTADDLPLLLAQTQRRLYDRQGWALEPPI